MRHRFALVSLAALAAAGCSPRVDHLGSAASGGAFNPGLYRSLLSRVEPEVNDTHSPPVAALPMEAGRVVQVRTRRHANGLTQTIVLAADRATRGENVIEVTMRTEPEGERYENLVSLKRPDAADIQKELDERFPGADMQMQPFILRNAYGPYGLAAGRQGAGVTCVYVWQWLDDIDAGHKGRHVTLHATEASLRMRLCREGMGERQLAELASSLVIDRNGAIAMPVAGGFSGGGDALAAAVQEPAGVARPTGFAGYRLPPAAKAVAQARAEPVVRRPKVRKTRLVRPARDTEFEPAPTVRRAAPIMPQAGLYAPYSAQPAYYQPAPAEPVRVGVSGRSGVAAVAQGPRSLDASLPPQAYRGPGAGAYAQSVKLR